MLKKEFVPRLNVIRKKEGTMLQSNGDIKRRWTQYCSSLYKDPGGEDCMVEDLREITPPGDEDPPAAIKSLKKK